MKSQNQSVENQIVEYSATLFFNKIKDNSWVTKFFAQQGFDLAKTNVGALIRIIDNVFHSPETLLTIIRNLNQDNIIETSQRVTDKNLASISRFKVFQSNPKIQDYLDQLRMSENGILLTENSRSTLAKIDQYKEQILQHPILQQSDSSDKSKLKAIMESPFFWKMFMDSHKGKTGEEAYKHVRETGWLSRAHREYDALLKFKNTLDKLLHKSEKLSLGLFEEIAISLWPDSFENKKSAGIRKEPISFGSFTGQELIERMTTTASDIVNVSKIFDEGRNSYGLDCAYMLEDSGLGDSKRIQQDWSAEKLKIFIEGLFESYNNYIRTTSDRESKLEAVSEVILMLSWLHPTNDCSSRIIIKTLLQYMLVEIGETPVFFSDNIDKVMNSDFKGFVHTIKEGQLNFLSLYDKFKDGSLAKENNDIVENILNIQSWTAHFGTDKGMETNKNSYKVDAKNMICMLDPLTVGKNFDELSDKELKNAIDIITQKLEKDKKLPEELHQFLGIASDETAFIIEDIIDSMIDIAFDKYEIAGNHSGDIVAQE